MINKDFPNTRNHFTQRQIIFFNSKDIFCWKFNLNDEIKQPAGSHERAELFKNKAFERSFRVQNLFWIATGKTSVVAEGKLRIDGGNSQAGSESFFRYFETMDFLTTANGKKEKNNMLKKCLRLNCLILGALLFISFQTTQSLAQTQAKPISLVSGSVFNAQLSRGQKHFFKIGLKAQEFIKIDVEQQGVDVILSFLGPDGKGIKVDTPNGTEGLERIIWVAEMAGDYQLVVEMLEPTAQPGKYNLQVQEIRPAMDLDLMRMQNRRLISSGITGKTEDLIGQTAPQINLLDNDGKTRNLKEFSGKIMVLNFWATWCPPCRAELPVLEDLQKRFSKDGVIFLGVNDEDEKTANTYLKNQGITIPSLFDEWLEGRLKYKLTSIPKTLIIDAGGKVVNVFTGLKDEDVYIEALTKLKANN